MRRTAAGGAVALGLLVGCAGAVAAPVALDCQGSYPISIMIDEARNQVWAWRVTSLPPMGGRPGFTFGSYGPLCLTDCRTIMYNHVIDMSAITEGPSAWSMHFDGYNGKLSVSGAYAHPAIDDVCFQAEPKGPPPR